MPRRREVPKRPVMDDPKYGDQLVTKFMNIVMLDGKKAVAEQIVYGALDVVLQRTREEPLKIFHRALENCQPMVEVKSRRVGGAMVRHTAGSSCACVRAPSAGARGTYCGHRAIRRAE